MKYFILSGLISLSLFQACKESKTKQVDTKSKNFQKDALEPGPLNENNDVSFSISLPDGWIKLDTTIMSHQITFLKSPLESSKDNFIENVNVVTEKAGSISLEDYAEKSLASMESGLESFENKKVSDRNINGVQFKYLLSSHEYGGVSVIIESYLTIKNETAFVITCSAKNGELSHWQPKFDEIMQSFNLH